MPYLQFAGTSSYFDVPDNPVFTVDTILVP